MKRAFLVIALLAACGAAAWWWLRNSATQVQWQGYVEADFVRLAPTQSGQLVALDVARGDKVKAGALLFVQDEAGDKATRDQAAAQLTQAEAKLRNLQAASRDTEIQQAEAQLADMRAARDRIAQDLARNSQLLRTGAATKQLVDEETNDLASATAKVNQADARLQQMREPTGRQQEIQQQQGAVDAARATLADAEWHLEQRRVTAPAAGSIVDTYARPGEMLMAGAPVVELLPPENVFVRFFVPEPLLPSIHLGERMAIHCDVCGNGIVADVSFISPQAEYTPPVIYSEASRGKLAYLIEARPAGDAAVRLNPGQPVDVRPLKHPSPPPGGGEAG